MGPILKAPRGIAFLADAMLGSVARKLRIFGFDTIYVVHAHDDEILKIGMKEGRVILTADKELFKRVVKTGMRGVLVSGAGDSDDLVHILFKSDIACVDPNGIGSRCSVCNGLLEDRTPEQVKNEIPDSICVRHRIFFQCVACNKVYWDGSHLKRIRSLAKNIDSRLCNAAGAT